MTVSDRVIFLQERTPLALLPAITLVPLARRLEPMTLAAGETVVEAGQNPQGLYIVWQGKLETEAELNGVSFLPGAVINLEALLLEQPVEQTIRTITDSTLWFVDRAQFQALVEQYPGILQTFTRQLVDAMKRLSFQFDLEQERQGILRPYLVAKARRGVIGRSRYGDRLRAEIREAASHRRSVLIFGEPGLEKDNLAALIHFGSSQRRQPIIKVDCGQLQASGADLFGRSGGRLGLLGAIGQGTLVLNNPNELDADLVKPVAQLLKTGQYRPVGRNGNAPLVTAEARIILLSEQGLPVLNDAVDETIKVPPLRVRKADLEDWVNYYLSLICRRRGTGRISVTPEAIRRLQSYDFPNNLRELENLVERAAAQLSGGGLITEEIIWPAQSKKKQLRLNLLNRYPNLRRFLRSPWWPDRINYGLTLGLFAVVIAVLWFGPQQRENNVALTVFWAWWWPLVLLSFPFVGRLWCAVCPFMIYGEVTQWISQKLFPGRLKRWPRQAADRWGGWFLFALFALILIWEEVWHLEDSAYLSACLLLLITAGAMIFSALFERRFWCRYLCPIGGMNGMFAKLSITELRAQQGTCSAECTTYQCYKGGPAKGEGQETNGCPLYSHPAQLEDNRDCVLCMTCLKACPHRSVELNLRPPGIELWTTHRPRAAEVALMFLLLGAVYLHRLPELEARLGIDLPTGTTLGHSLVSLGILALPALLPLTIEGGQWIWRKSQGLTPRPVIRLAYGYLPLVWAANLAHYLRLGLGEGGRILPVSLATFGASGINLPVWVAHPAVVAFLQGATLLLGMALSVWLTTKICRQSGPQRWIQHACTGLLGLSLWWLIPGF
ncbi:cyclic nucleotide-binding domain-containing protein [Nodosilinea sp. LEGE 07298]|uniref:cyclic nucleotide-binding domain-containing protein n=1 Tax=Nodosilinea sp. LEGE 07298 TaxID=2777970 RepID=UPI001881FCED|nr:cyclic nucleotide-binding domain-containing protein [Nodosilinea sp. LEGE 07298]MBE9112043.1 cyclic nucleotide-binding domain-containing protein [Nodosilinea sp. LEGE 07298]